MATIKSQMTLNDGMSAVLKKITSALDTTLAAFEQVQRASGQAIDTALFEQAHTLIAQANEGVDQMANYYAKAAKMEERLNQNIHKGTSAADGMLKKVISLVGAYASISAVKGFSMDALEAADVQIGAQVQLRTVLDNMGTGFEGTGTEIENTLVLDTTGAMDSYNAFADSISGDVFTATVTADTGQAMTAYDAIVDKAAEIQGRGMFGDEAMIAGAAELGTYFTDAEAIMSMMDTLTNYAVGMSNGEAVDASAMVDYATNLGKIMTGSYDAMSKKGFKFTEVQQAIIEGSATEQQIIDTLGAEYVNLSSDMQAAAVISDIIDESWAGLYETMSNTPFGLITQLDNALGDVKENVGAGIYPTVLNLVHTVQANLPQINAAAMGLATVLGVIVTVLTGIVTGALALGTTIADNWSWIEPIMWGIVAALVTYGGYLGITSALEAAHNISLGLSAVQAYAAAAANKTLSAAQREKAMADAAATASQYGFNAALLACPVTWIVLGIIALIAVIVAVVRAFDIWGAESTSVIGTICGLVAVAASFIANAAIGLVNALITIAWMFVEPFLGIIEWVLNVCNGGFDSFGGAVANLIGQIIGWFLNLGKVVTTIIDAIFGTNWTAGLEALQNTVTAWGKNENAITLDKSAPTIDYRIEYGSAFDAGASFGDGITDKVGDLFDPNLGTMDDLMAQIPNIPGMDNMGSDIANIAGNTGSMAKSLEISGEELEYLRDIAERDAINRFTTAEVKIDMTGMTNKIDGSVDLDGVIRELTDGFAEALVTAAEGVH